MKTATAISILATVISTSEGKKSKTSNDFYNSKDGDRFAAKWEPSHDDWWGTPSPPAPSHDDWWGAPSHDDWWGAPSHDDHDDWWAPSSSSHDEWWAPSSHDEWWGSSAKPRSGWNSKSSKSSKGHDEWWGSSAKPSNGWSSKSSKPSGSWNGWSGKGDGWSGSSGFHCKHKTFYIDLDVILDDVESGSNKFTNSYTNYRAYKSSSDVGNNSYDGIFAYRREEVSQLSCQGQGMLGLDGGPIFKDQIYVSTMCDPFIDEPENSGFITDGGITGGFGDYASATGTMKYEKSGGTGKLKFWICLPYGTKWGSSGGDWESSSSHDGWKSSSRNKWDN